MPVTTLGKRRQERYVISSDSIPEADGSDSDRYESHPQKKVKQDMTMVMDAARTIKGSFPATKTQQSSNGDPEEAARSKEAHRNHCAGSLPGFGRCWCLTGADWNSCAGRVIVD